MLINIAEKEPGRLLVKGGLTFANIDKNSPGLLPLNRQPRQLILDLRHVSHADSAGLALLIEWLKIAQRKQIDLIFENTPQQILTIARLSGLELMNRFTR